MDREQAIQVLSEMINNCVKRGAFESSSEVIMAHNAMVVLAQASATQPETVMPPQEDKHEEEKNSDY